MLPVCYPSSPSSTTGLPEAVAYALPSVSGLTRWVDYIPIKLVSGQIGANENTTNNNGGFVAMRLLGSSTGLNAWRDYIPVYVDNSATEAWVTSATGYIPYASSVGSSTQYMIEGMNLSPVANWTNACQFANICFQMEGFKQIVGSGSFTQSQGTLVATVGTDEFRAVISDKEVDMPSGTYTVYNPSGANIAIGNYGTASTYVAYTTATQFTFSFTAGPTIVLALWVKGSLSNASGNVEIVMPGVTRPSVSGNIWNPAYLSFLQTLSPRTLRFMDHASASGSIETDWADRSVTGKVSFFVPMVNAQYSPVGASIVPWEYQIDLANRLNIDPWFCLPTRSTSDYVTQFATLVKNTLNAGLRPYIEHGNEVWNTALPWGEGTNWVTYGTFTRYTATGATGTNIYTLANHGLSNNEQVRCFTSKANLAAESVENWMLSYGNAAYVAVIDANTFTLRETAGGTVIPVGAKQVDQIYIRTTEGGKSTALDVNYANLLLRDWDIIDPIIGVNDYNRLVVRQVSNISTLTNTLAVTGITSRASYVSGAPYYSATLWAGKISIATGAFTPYVWGCPKDVNANYIPLVVHVGVYAAGSTPTEEEIIAGTGTGIVNHQSVSFTYAGSASWGAGSAVTGLTDGVSYEVYFLAVGTEQNYVSSQTLVASATPSDAYFYDSETNQSLRYRRAIKDGSMARSSAYITAAGSIPLICYEGGNHNTENMPAQLETWFLAYQESAEQAEVLLNYLYRLSSIGTSQHVYYSDVASSPFRIADGALDVTDRRYLALVGVGGRVAKQPELSVSDVLAADITALPTLPYTITTLPAETGRTYALVGVPDSNFDISGNDLRMVAATGINWLAPLSRTMRLEAYRGHLSDTFNVTFATGSSWFASDANFAFSTVNDTDTAAANPESGFGGALTLSGTAATYGGGLWDMQTTTKYTSSTGSLATFPASGTPFMFAMVMDKDSQGLAYVPLAVVGAGAAYVQFALNGTSVALQTWFGATTDVNIQTLASMTNGVPVVFWMYSDGAANPTYYVGSNQTDKANMVVTAANGKTISRTVTIGAGSAVIAKLGSTQVVSRAGMTLADAKAIVAKMQTHHGIA